MDICSQCGSTIPPETAPGGFCPQCLLKLGLVNEGGETDGSLDPATLTFSTKVENGGHEGVGAEFGPYKAIRVVGEGGMGIVYLAEQAKPIRRQVALKVIKAGMDTREVVRRFESERQVLALMDHPAIAKVFDAGSTPQGRPYFVMELVAGIPINAYCDQHTLAIPQRLELFIYVCEGVQHAHQKAIIHRDLKPSNILVSEGNGEPIPRIIDFGIAKATSQPFTGETLFTRAGTIVGTPGYMSPEQADSGGGDIDTRTDVYSLGVVLFELLVGALPLDLNKLPCDEILRKLREQDSPKPSAKLRSMGAESTTGAQKRATDPQTLTRLLSGDLDAIVLKALEKNRSLRYATPSELAADIGRFLRNEPVTAHKLGVVYLTRKYVRRHRIGVAVAVAVVVLLASFAIAQTFEIGRIMLARDRATRERDRADRVTQFMTNMFKLPNPSEARGNKAIAREILDQASKDIDNGLANDPELRAKMMDTMAATYLNLGLITRAQPLLERAAQLQRRVLGSAHRDTLASMSLLASTYVDVEPARAEKLLRETLATQRRVLGPEHPDVLGSMDRLVTVLLSKNDYAGAEKLLREMLDRQRRALGRDDVNTLTSMDRLAFTLSNYDARYAEAEKLYRETLDIQRRVLGQEHPETLWSLGGLAATLLHEARYHEAEKLYGETIDVQRRVLGPEHPQTLKSLEEEAIAISRQGRYSEAEVLFRQTIQIAGKSNEPGVLGRAWYNFGCTAAVAGHRDDALKYLTEAVDHGYKHAEWMEADNDLKSLHGDPLFEAIVAKGRDSATAKP